MSQSLSKIPKFPEGNTFCHLPERDLVSGHFLFPEGDTFTSPGLCGNALPWEQSRFIQPIPGGDEYTKPPVMYPFQGMRRSFNAVPG